MTALTAKCDSVLHAPLLPPQGKLELQAGCNLEQTLEVSVTGVLNNIREQAGKVGGPGWTWVGRCPVWHPTLAQGHGCAPHR